MPRRTARVSGVETAMELVERSIRLIEERGLSRRRDLVKAWRKLGRSR